MRLLAVIALLMLALPGRAALDERLEGIDLLRLSGDYRSAIALTRVELDQDPGNPRLEQVRGELLLATGELDAAAVIFDRLGASPGPERLSAWLKRAEIHRQRGEIDAAEKLWRGLREAYQTAQTLSARDLFSIADATRELGRGDPQLFKDAVWLYDQAKRKDPALLDAGIAQGELLLEKYNSEEASAAFREVLEVDDDHPRALLGLARSQHFDYSTQAVSTVQEALSLNPNLVPARIFAARLHVEVEQYAEAQVEVEAALGVNPVSLEALAMQGAIAWLEHDAHRFDTIEAKILALNPRYAEFYATLAELAAQNRLYREAEDFASRAVELDAQSWRGHGLLGMNRLRLGQIDAGRASLETSFAGDRSTAVAFASCCTTTRTPCSASTSTSSRRKLINISRNAIDTSPTARFASSSTPTTTTSRCARSAWPALACSALPSARWWQWTLRRRVRRASSTGALRCGTNSRTCSTCR
jgi:tetratricopeptide (TPR) repeat protein